MASLTLYAGNTANIKSQGEPWDVPNYDEVSNNTEMSIEGSVNGVQENSDRWRSPLYFDTSSIPDNAIISDVTIRLYVTAKTTDGASSGIQVTLSTSTNTSTYATSDYNKVSTALGSLAKAGITTSAWNEISLTNPSTNISKTGNTQMFLLENYDYVGTYPGNSQNIYTISGSNDGTYKPQLVITYSLPAGFFALL